MFVSAVIQGRARQLESLLDGLRLIPLDKRPGVRPIGCGEPLMKVVQGVWQTVLAEEVEDQFRPVQFACGIPAGSEALGRELQIELEDERAKDNSINKYDARNYYNLLNREHVVRVVAKTDPFFAWYLARIFEEPSVYTVATTEAEAGWMDLPTITGVVQGNVIAYLVGCLVAADAEHEWTRQMLSAFPFLTTTSVHSPELSSTMATRNAGEDWKKRNADAIANMNEKAGQSRQLCAIRGNVDDQTTSLPRSLEPLARDLLKSVFRPSGTQFRDDKQKQWDKAADPDGGLIVAGLPLWSPVDRHSTLPDETAAADFRPDELWIGIGNHEFLRKNCVEPAFVSLKSALDALKVIWENRPGGRPALQLIIRLLRLCVCQRFVHFARWFPPAITTTLIVEARRQLSDFFFDLLGWSAHFISREHREFVAAQIRLPCKGFGGLGFGLVANSDAAFLASWFSPLDTIAKHRATSVEALLLEWDTASTQPNPPSFVRGMRESMLRLPRPQGSLSALWKSFSQTRFGLGLFNEGGVGQQPVRFPAGRNPGPDGRNRRGQLDGNVAVIPPRVFFCVFF